jgi:hypothetical protein
MLAMLTNTIYRLPANRKNKSQLVIVLGKALQLEVVAFNDTERQNIREADSELAILGVSHN